MWSPEQLAGGAGSRTVTLADPGVPRAVIAGCWAQGGAGIKQRLCRKSRGGGGLAAVCCRDRAVVAGERAVLCAAQNNVLV